MTARPVPSTRNVLRVFRATSERDRIEGRAWYGVARALAEALDPADPSRAAAVIAVLSPRVRWERNVDLAHDAYAGRPIGTMTKHAVKARAIVAGSDPDVVVSGPKVRAFWATIKNPREATAVVVDRHAIDIALGRTTDEATREATAKRKGYERVAECYRRAARIASRETGEPWSPSELQAATWLYWRRVKVR